MARKKIRNLKPTANDHCTQCGRPYAHLHEVFFGKDKYMSQVYGMQERLCQECHQGTNGVHGKNGEELDSMLKKKHQRLFEEKYSYRKFMEVFIKNYLWDEE